MKKPPPKPNLMNNKTSWKIGLSGLAAATGIRTWMSTLQYRAFFYDPAVEAADGCEQPRIYVFWHEYILIPLYLRGHCDLAMLLSRHRDADVLTRVAYHMGFDCVRGSTNRGALSALRELSQLGQHKHLAITPDGPRGPRRQLAQGPIYLASTLGIPIVPLGFGVDRPWRAKSWDQFAVPRPFSQVRSVLGPEIHIRPNLDRDEIEVCRGRIERLLTDLTIEAENWAASGTRREGEVVVRPQTRVLRTSSNEPTNTTSPALLRISPKHRAAG